MTVPAIFGNYFISRNIVPWRILEDEVGEIDQFGPGEMNQATCITRFRTAREDQPAKAPETPA